MTSHVECKTDGVQIDRFETLYSKLVNKLTAEPFIKQDDPQNAPNVIRELLDSWCNSLLKKIGINLDGIARPFNAEERAYAELNRGLLRTNLPPEFTRALATYVRATLSDDYDARLTISNWLQGADGRFKLPDHYVSKPVVGPRRSSSTFELKPVGKGTARELMRGILWLVRANGFKGLLLCIDEVEEIAKLGSRRREDQALQALRDFVDNAGSEVGFHHFCMYLAATPPMFDNADYFPRYDALATRIQPIGPEINWRAPVVDLDRTPLSQAEMLAMARRIHAVHQAAYGLDATSGLSGETVEAFVSEVNHSRFRIAKPRLLARFLVDQMERARQNQAVVDSKGITQAIQNTAEKILKEQDA
jgi:hypothetical protein